MKRILSILIVCLLALTLTTCNTKVTTNDEVRTHSSGSGKF